MIKQKPKTVNLENISPHVRFVQYFEANETNFYLPWRVIYDTEMMFVTEGECVVETEDDKYVVSAGQIHVMEPFIRHKRYVKPKNGEGGFKYFDVHYDWVYDENNADFSVEEMYLIPSWQQVEQIIADFNLLKRNIYKFDGMQPCSAMKVKKNFLFNELFTRLNEVYNSEEKHKSLKLRGIFLEILAEFFDEMEEEERANGWSDVVNKYLAYVSDNYQKDVDLEELSRSEGISPSHFRKIFKSIMNKAPHEFLIDYRIEQAKKLLMSHKYTITEVSFMVGYDDYHYFSRIFKNKEGVSPKAFLDNNS